MAEPGRRPRAQGIAGTWPLDGRAQAGGFAPAGSETWSSFVAKLKAWTRAEAGAGRLLPWVPVAFSAGITLYFTADREPVLWVTAVPAALLCCLCWAMRRHRLFAVSVLVAAVAAGFATATFRTAHVAHARNTWSR
jgi:competence protein ComEC